MLRAGSARRVSASSASSRTDGRLNKFASSHEGPYSVSVLGDLHLEPGQMHLFHEAQQQLAAAMSQAGSGARVVQLGDLGGYKYKPGSRACFQTAVEYLDGFQAPVALILGNHDLEGDEFEEDVENLAAWHEAFQQHHYWASELGPVLAVGLSTVRFRSNQHSVHEVYIDDEQFSWLEQVLAANKDRPIVVFTHAPPMGCGLKVVENVHIKNRCAFLNHSDRPQRFIRLVEANPNIKLWFSGHFHLSQNYLDSISVVGSCAFVQTGVIGECNRDGNRQSRLLRFDAQGYQLFTVDHNSAGNLRLDLQQPWASASPPVPVTPQHEVIPDPNAGWLSSRLECGLTDSMEEELGKVQWHAAGPNVMLAVQDDMLVEYDVEMRAPVGIVAFLEGRRVSLVTAAGTQPVADDGSDVAAVLLTDSANPEVTRLERNEAGSFYRIFQANKWVARKKKEREEAAAAAAAAAAAQAQQLVGSSSTS
uniref:Calcineurin-like phosphoesterase domain-containing protein n=1 Tax=Tetradesmus obliquus TaxID=3088 RepID=A0A383VZZ7_TETOB|eukprot:jgi/Sobl393_1/2214/SZX70443.1